MASNEEGRKLRRVLLLASPPTLPRSNERLANVQGVARQGGYNEFHIAVVVVVGTDESVSNERECAVFLSSLSVPFFPELLHTCYELCCELCCSPERDRDWVRRRHVKSRVKYPLHLSSSSRDPSPYFVEML